MTSSATVNTGRHLLLVYCDLLGDYLLFRYLLRALMPQLTDRYKTVTWLCNPGVAKLANILDADLTKQMSLIPVEEADWKRLNWTKLPRFILQRKRFRSLLVERGIPLEVDEIWCPSVAPFEDNVLSALPKASRKLGRHVQTAALDWLQRLVYTELLTIPNYDQFIFYQHGRFFEQALNNPLPGRVVASPLSALPSGCDVTPVLSASKRSMGLDQHQPYVAVFPESAGVYKEWPPQKFAALINQLAGAFPDWYFVLSGQRQEVSESIIRLLTPQALARTVNLTGLTTVAQVLGLIQGSDVVICNDSFPLHAANAVETPFVCIANGQFQGRYYPYPDELRYSRHDYVLTQPDERLQDIPVSRVLAAVQLALTEQSSGSL